MRYSDYRFPSSRKGKIASIGFLALLTGENHTALIAFAAIAGKEQRRTLRRPDISEITKFFIETIENEYEREQFIDEWNERMEGDNA